MPEAKTCNEVCTFLEQKELQWERLCVRCGACCGAYDDPCQHLKKDSQGAYYCKIYPQRFGTRRTTNGESFDCVHIREIMHTHWKNDHLCIYKKYTKTPWIALNNPDFRGDETGQKKH